MELTPRFYALSAFTPMALGPVVQAMAPVPAEFPDDFFLTKESLFGREIENDPALMSLYMTAFDLSANHFGMPEWAQFWPARVDLLKVIGQAKWGRSVETLQDFVRNHFPDPETALRFAEMAWFRDQYTKLRDYFPAVESRFVLGTRILKELPVLDRLLSQRIAEAGYRGELSEDAWVLVVGDLAMRVRPVDSDPGAVADLPVKSFIDGLQRAPASMWEDSVNASAGGKGFFCLLAPLFSGIRKPLGEAVSRDRVPAIYAGPAGRPEPLLKAGQRQAVANFILEGIGAGALNDVEQATYGRLIENLGESNYREMVAYEGAKLLVVSYLEAVVRYGAVSGFLERRSASGAGSLRTHQRSYASAFVAQLEAVFEDQLAKTPLMDTSVVFRLATVRLWAFYVVCRSHPSFGLEADWDRFKTLFEGFQEMFSQVTSEPSVDRDTPVSVADPMGAVTGEKMDLTHLFSQANSP